MPEKLSQDLPELIDIFGDDTPEVTEVTDIIPEEDAATETETKDETTETTDTTETTETTDTETTETKKEEEVTLDSILGEGEEVTEDISKVADKTEEMKDTIEEAKDAIKEEDTDSAEKLIDDLYTQVIDYSTKIDTLWTKNEILQSKLVELTKSNSEFELQIAQTANVSSDPKMIILNRMYADAIDGKEFAKDKVLSTLEDMYYNITGKSFDTSYTDKVSDGNAEDVVLNTATEPAIEDPAVEEVDPNDITSIF